MKIAKQFTFALWICSSYSNYYGIVHQDIINHGETCFNVDILLYKIFIANTHYVSGSCATIYPAQNESQPQVNWKVPWNTFKGVKRLKVNADCFFEAYFGGKEVFSGECNKYF